MDKRELIIGIDLRNDYSQLSYALNLTDEPSSISLEGQEDQILIPTTVGLVKNKKQWIYGREAKIMAEEKEAQVATKLLDKIKEKREVKIYGSFYDPVYILERYIYKILMELKIKWPDKNIKQMVVTICDTDTIVVDGIYKALENLGLGRDRVSVQSYSRSYVAYVLSQEKGIWMNDVALFDFDEKGFDYFQMSVDRRQIPHLARVKVKNYDDSIKYSKLGQINFDGNLDYILENIINDALYMQIISTIYFTGKGFIDGIPMSTIKKISKGRKIYIGQNLYCKGACYSAVKLARKNTLDNFVFLVDDTIHYSVSTTINDNDTEKDIYLGSLGASIFEKSKVMELILDEADQVRYKVRDKRGSVILEDAIVLDDLPKRPNKSTRIEVTLILISNSRFKLKIRDKGFGEIYPATDKVWEKEVAING